MSNLPPQQPTPYGTPPVQPQTQQAKSNTKVILIILGAVFGIMLVLALPVIIIIAIGVSNYSSVETEAKVKVTQLRLEDLKKNIMLYQIRMDSLPERLESLRDGPSDAAKKAKWVSPLITEIPLDGWENELVYTVNGNSYEIRSGGVDGKINTDDDIITLKGY